MSQNNTFMNLPITDGMKETIKKIGYTNPTPIQEKAIPELLQGKDVLGQAQTGTGKTAAFSIPLIELVNATSEHIQALVVCPTRELCLQVCQEIQKLSAHKNSLSSVALYGGQSIEQQFRTLKFDKPQIVVATPGRLFDHLRRKSVSLSEVQMIVLDEADEMLDMGFRPEIEQIFELLPETNQRIFFSATMPKAINDLACTYLRDPCIVKTEAKTLTTSTITQSYLKVRGREKTELLCRLLDYKDPKLAVVFTNAKSTADEIVDEICERGFDAGVLHGDLSQSQRDRVMAKFKAGIVRVLVATDVAARGLDIDDVELVFNYHLPHDPEDYVHRIGRTGRAGRTGMAISLVEPRDNTRLRRISQFARIEIKEEFAPTANDVRQAKIAKLFSDIQQALSSEKIKEYKSILAKQALDVGDVAAAMMQMTLKKIDERLYDDKSFAEMSDRKYSGSGEKRFRDRPNRNSSRESRGSWDRDRPSRDRRDSGGEVRGNRFNSRDRRSAEDGEFRRDDRAPRPRTPYASPRVPMPGRSERSEHLGFGAKDRPFKKPSGERSFVNDDRAYKPYRPDNREQRKPEGARAKKFGGEKRAASSFDRGASASRGGEFKRKDSGRFGGNKNR